MTPLPRDRMAEQHKTLSLRVIPIALMLAGVCLLSLQCNSTRPGQVRHSDEALWPARVPDRIDFARDVRPLLEDQCLECHNHVDARDFAGLNLETRISAFTSGRRAPVIVPGDARKSLLIQVLKLNPSHATSMPAAPEKVKGVRLAILEKWINQGADWPKSVRLVRPQDVR
ncbi:MAG: hypothetical protein ACI9R3_002274 [Verrucomicrobiales bacterium]|jgi:hypothetical protein